MQYPSFKNEEAFALKHERLLTTCKVSEINYQLFFLVLVTPFFVGLFSRIAIIPSIGAILLSLPLIFRRWQLDLTNKRLITRRWFAGLERFFTFSSIRLSTIETLQTTPRIKILPLLLGYWIVTSYGLPLIEFGLTASIPLPFLVKILVFFGSYFETIHNAEIFVITNFVEPIFLVTGNFALIIGFILLVVGTILFSFGLPFRKEFRIRTISGHEFQLQTGIPPSFIQILNSIIRKHHVVGVFENEIEFPMLFDENLRAQGRLGLIDRKNQLAGLMSLIIFFRGIGNLIGKLEFTTRGLMSFSLSILDFVLILFLIIYAKTFQKIWTTDHRIIFQEERRGISGLWGKRIYSYSDLPYAEIQGYIVSYFSGFSPYSLSFGIFYFASLPVILVPYVNPNVQSIIFLLGIIFGLIFLTINFRTYGELTLLSVGGNQIRLFFRTPYLISKLSHRLEGKEGIAEKVFPNLLSDNQIQKICNLVRGIDNPRRKLTKEAHFLDLDSFIDKNEEIFFKIEKISPEPYFRLFGFLFILTGILSIWINFHLHRLHTGFVTIMLLGSFIFLAFRSISFFIVKRKTLILTGDRVLLETKTEPNRLAQRLGFLPTWKIKEIRLEFVTAVKSRFIFPQANLSGFPILILLFLISMLWTFSFFYPSNSFFLIDGFSSILSISGIIMIYLLEKLFVNIMQSLPRYGLQIDSRKGSMAFSHFPKPLEFENAFFMAFRDFEGRNLSKTTMEID